ncbi:MAG: diguanylate cyclase [Pirellulaceae bacterium]|nr:diguanylate cyclase [Pirellulaceae bacterium]
MFRFKVTYKIALVLVALSVGPLMVAALTGLIPVSDIALMKERQIVAEQMAAACATVLDDGKLHRLDARIESFLQGKHHIRLVRIARFDGKELYANTGFQVEWTLPEGAESALNQFRVPILRNQKTWAEVELIFDNPSWHSRSVVRFVGLILLALAINSVSFILFLNRSLSVLEPNNAVPRRVRNTLDTIAGGVVVLDAKGRIMMANESFTKSLACKREKIVGSRLSTLPWRLAKDAVAPWDVAVQEQRRCEGTQVFLPMGDGEERCFVVNATPVLDSNERMAGSLISFEDITVLEEKRKSLVLAMAELAKSKEEVREQNVLLTELAARDALTGAFNRRSLFEHLEKSWNEIDCQPDGMVTLMIDIDHFKKLNDQHGHSVGDEVLKDFTKLLQENVGTSGIVARYGGEEFFILLKNCSLKNGMHKAEKLRHTIVTKLAKPYAVTASIGLSSICNHPESISKWIEQADKALYAAKNGGRNQVQCWTPDIDKLEENNKTRAIAAQDLSLIDNHPISYHAVLSLHAALTFRHADTAIHSQRVAELCMSIGRELIPANELYKLEIAALLHDIGKIGVPDAILTKPGPLTEEEWKFMEAHEPIGIAIVETAFSSPELMDVLKFHHCRYDGKNQDPTWPSGKDIPLFARIVSIADAYDAMVSDRCYRKGRPYEEAIAELRRCAGGQFDPDLVERFANAKTGWRLDSRFAHDEEIEKNAVDLGYHMERVIHSFEIRDPGSLRLRLGILKTAAIKCDMPHIAAIVEDIIKDSDRKSIGEWESLLPILTDLIEVCSTIQRAYLSHVGAKPINIDDCTAQDFLREASRKGVIRMTSEVEQ